VTQHATSVKCTVSWPRGYSKTKFFLQGPNPKKKFTGAKPKVVYITGGKDLLTLKIMLSHYKRSEKRKKNEII